MEIPAKWGVRVREVALVEEVLEVVELVAVGLEDSAVVLAVYHRRH